MLGKRAKGTASVPPQLKPMTSFNPYEPAILHDRLTDKIETWTGEDAGDFRESAISNPDGLSGDSLCSTDGATFSGDSLPKRNLHKPWTTGEDDRLMTLRAEGRTSVSIGAALKPARERWMLG